MTFRKIDVSPDAHLVEGTTNIQARHSVTGVLHNRAGPAVADATTESFYIDGVNLTKDQWLCCVQQGLRPNKVSNLDYHELQFYRGEDLHAVGMPACINEVHGEMWYNNGILHRLDGPAVLTKSGDLHYFISGHALSHREFCAWKAMGPGIWFIRGNSKIIIHRDGLVSNVDINAPVRASIPFSLYNDIMEVNSSLLKDDLITALFYECNLTQYEIMQIAKTRTAESIRVYLNAVRHQRSTDSPEGKEILTAAIKMWYDSVIADSAKEFVPKPDDALPSAAPPDWSVSQFEAAELRRQRDQGWHPFDCTADAPLPPDPDPETDCEGLTTSSEHSADHYAIPSTLGLLAAATAIALLIPKRKNKKAMVREAAPSILSAVR